MVINWFGFFITPGKVIPRNSMITYVKVFPRHPVFHVLNITTELVQNIQLECWQYHLLQFESHNNRREHAWFRCGERHLFEALWALWKGKAPLCCNNCVEMCFGNALITSPNWIKILRVSTFINEEFSRSFWWRKEKGGVPSNQQFSLWSRAH